jgi:hypothetical protein
MVKIFSLPGDTHMTLERLGPEALIHASAIGRVKSRAFIVAGSAAPPVPRSCGNRKPRRFPSDDEHVELVR